MNTGSSSWRDRLEELLMESRARSLTTEEHAELNNILRTDAEARAHAAQFLLDDAALTECLRESQVEAIFREEGRALAGIRESVVAKPRRSIWLQWRPLTAAAAGLVFGMFCTSMVFAYATPKFANAKAEVRRLWIDSFESGITQTLPGLPREVDVWSGDEARVVDAEAGLKPKSGAKMLRFDSTTFAGENPGRSGWGNVYRLVDLRGKVGAGEVALRLSANFDATRFPEGEEYVCFLELCALEEDPAQAPQPLTLPWVRENSASVAGRKILMKDDGVWQAGSVTIPVSAQTRYALVHLAVQRRKPEPSSEPVRFSGHYLDEVKLELRSQPLSSRTE